MFGNNKTLPHNEATVIEKDCLFTGTINSDHSVIIKGKFHGKICCKSTITIEEGAFLKSNLEAEELSINGEVEGNIIATGCVSIGNEGVVTGDISSKELQVESGGTFNGSCQVGEMDVKEESDTTPLLEINQKSA